MSTMGSRIMRLRKDAKLNQDDLAKKVGVPNVTISMWESNTTAPRGGNLSKLCKVLACDIDWLLTGKELDGISAARQRLASIVSELTTDLSQEELDDLERMLKIYSRGISPKG